MGVSGPRPRVAAFDVDGTLTTRDCVRPFLVRLAGWRGVLVALARHAPRIGRAVLHSDRDTIKELVVGSVFAGRAVGEVERIGRQFATDVHRAWMRAELVERFDEHRRRGDQVLLVSASLGPYLRPLGALLGADAVLCTEVAHERGRYTGRLDGANCRAEEKAARLAAWCAARGLDDAEVWAYGDSAGDDALLAAADHPWRRGRGELAPLARSGATPGSMGR